MNTLELKGGMIELIGQVKNYCSTYMKLFQRYLQIQQPITLHCLRNKKVD